MEHRELRDEITVISNVRMNGVSQRLQISQDLFDVITVDRLSDLHEEIHMDLSWSLDTTIIEDLKDWR